MPQDVVTRHVRLSYPLRQVKEPVLHHLIMDYALVPNIMRAHVEVHSGGFIEMELTGTPDAMQRALRWLEGLGIALSDVEDTG